MEWKEARDDGEKAGEACLGRIMKRVGLRQGINQSDMEPNRKTE